MIQESGIEGLDLLPSGAVPPNPAELLSSQRMKVLLEAVQAQYDLVVLDVPPMLEVTDTQTIAGSVDGVVLVVRQGVTQKAGVRRAVELLKMSHAHLLGYVMMTLYQKTTRATVMATAMDMATATKKNQKTRLVAYIRKGESRWF